MPWCGVTTPEHATVHEIDAEIREGRVSLRLDSTERRMVRAVLREVIVESEREISKLLWMEQSRLEKFCELLDADAALDLDGEGLRVLKQALYEALYDMLPAWEFQTRVGYWPREVDALVRGLKEFRL